MNPLLMEFLSSLARFALAYVLGLLTHHGVIDETAAGRYAEAGSNWLVITGLTVGPLVWALFKARMVGRLKKDAKRTDEMIAVAIASPADTTVAEVKAKA